uniref:Uncharacterized protein n=1 Tax=Micrurus spixii TaxID=129469 RepID=A0A2D4M9Y2_9SAUR
MVHIEVICSALPTKLSNRGRMYADLMSLQNLQRNRTCGNLQLPHCPMSPFAQLLGLYYTCPAGMLKGRYYRKPVSKKCYSILKKSQAFQIPCWFSHTPRNLISSAVRYSVNSTGTPCLLFYW